MPPRSPLPQRDGLDAAWIRTPQVEPGAAWGTMREFLLDRLPAQAPVEEMLAAGEFVNDAGEAWRGDEGYCPHVFVWFHRRPAPEVPVPFPIDVIEQHERYVVVDKPHFLATTPRGAHARETALARLRVQLGLPELAPAHRLDRLTAGVLLFTTRREHRGAYGQLFQDRRVSKTYEALAPFDPALAFPRRFVNRIEKRRGVLQAQIVPGEPNAETLVEIVEVRGAWALYRLTPSTGQTHQLRVQMSALGLPLVGDPLYPAIVDVAPDDFSRPLQLIARRLAFADPIDGVERAFESPRALAWPPP
ncbi:pseudouridine synthase [uncultured Demequina sp.]|uniref:pseudouridine synthase n=1 Tax=uncultured Demequina sp. TaxID=693499 RepID=UPI0025E40E5E|nr:pseudouridine synthase [uncultured Demequina sp.]